MVFVYFIMGKPTHPNAKGLSQKDNRLPFKLLSGDTKQSRGRQTKGICLPIADNQESNLARFGRVAKPQKRGLNEHR